MLAAATRLQRRERMSVKIQAREYKARPEDNKEQGYKDAINKTQRLISSHETLLQKLQTLWRMHIAMHDLHKHKKARQVQAVWRLVMAKRLVETLRETRREYKRRTLGIDLEYTNNVTVEDLMQLQADQAIVDLGFRQVFERECREQKILPYWKHQAGEIVEIKLTHNRLGPRIATSLATALECQECSGIVSVVLSQNGLESGPAVRLLQAVSNKFFLHTLDLAHNKIGTEGALMLSQVIQQVANLTYLSIEGNQVGDLGVQALAKIQHLDLSHNDITPNSDAALSCLIQSADELRVFLLSQNGFAGRCAWPSPRTHAYMHTLDLSWNRLGDNGAMALGQWLPDAHGLSKLNIAYNGIGETGCAALLSTMRTVACSLTQLILDGNFIGSAGCLQMLLLLEVVPPEELAVSATECNLRSHNPSVIEPEELELLCWGAPQQNIQAQPEPEPEPDSDDKPVPGQVVLQLDGQYDVICLHQLSALVSRIGSEPEEIWCQAKLDGQKLKLPKSIELTDEDGLCQWLPDAGELQFVLAVPDPKVELALARKELSAAMGGAPGEEEGEIVLDEARVGRAQMTIQALKERKQRMMDGPVHIAERKVAAAKREAELAELADNLDSVEDDKAAFCTPKLYSVLKLMSALSLQERAAMIDSMPLDEALPALKLSPAEIRIETLAYIREHYPCEVYTRYVATEACATEALSQAEDLSSETDKLLAKMDAGESLERTPSELYVPLEGTEVCVFPFGAVCSGLDDNAEGTAAKDAPVGSAADDTAQSGPAIDAAKESSAAEDAAQGNTTVDATPDSATEDAAEESSAAEDAAEDGSAARDAVPEGTAAEGTAVRDAADGIAAADDVISATGELAAGSQVEVVVGSNEKRIPLAKHRCPIPQSIAERLDGVRKLRERLVLEMLRERPPLQWCCN